MNTFTVDIIGRRQFDDGTFSNELYVNALGDLPDDVIQYKVPSPATPIRVYAGVPLENTHFLVIPDYDTAMSLATKYNITIPGYDDNEEGV
jgi:hypothetical protein